MTPQDYKDILNGIGKWTLAMSILAGAGYMVIQGKIAPEVVIAGVSAVTGFYFNNSKSEVK